MSEQKRDTEYRDFGYELAFKVRTIRERLGLNQSEMSEKMGCETTMVKKYESGRSTVNLLYLSRAVAEVGLTLEDLLLDDGTFCKKLWF